MKVEKQIQKGFRLQEPTRKLDLLKQKKQKRKKFGYQLETWFLENPLRVEISVIRNRAFFECRRKE